MNRSTGKSDRVKPRAKKALPKGKWIEGTSPEEPLDEAARCALRTRLDLVWFYLRLAAKRADRDIEYVHQLRVSTRRAMATLETFEPLLPTRRAKWMKKMLRRARRAAGEARNFDVLGERLTDEAARSPDRDRSKLLAFVQSRRAEAQPPIKEIYGRLKRHDYPRRVDKLIERVQMRGEAAELPVPTFGEAARAALEPVLDRFFKAAAEDLTDIAVLHQLRIQGKQLRYAMEIFAGAFGPAFRGELYPQIEALQSKLGEINDHATAIELFESWLASSETADLRDELTELIARERAALGEAQERFLAGWTSKQTLELRAKFNQVLATRPEKQAG